MGVRSLLDRILSTSTFYARDLEGAVKQCRCTGLLLMNTTKQKQKQKNLITMGEYNSISSRDFSALRIYMRKTLKFNHRACAAT